MAMTMQVNLENGKFWAVGFGIVPGGINDADPSVIIIPADQIDGMSDAEIGANVKEYVWHAHYCRASEYADLTDWQTLHRIPEESLSQYLEMMLGYAEHSGQIELAIKAIELELDSRKKRVKTKKCSQQIRAGVSKNYDKLFVAIGRRDTFVCANCGNREELEIDHKIPVSAGGGNELENLQLLCRSCNRKKSNHMESPHESA